MFITKQIDLGVIQEGKKITVNFPYAKENSGHGIQVIKELNASCGCSVPSNSWQEGYVRVDFTPGAVPIHMTNEGKTSYYTEKNVIVKYLDEENRDKEEVLTFTATVASTKY